MHSGFPRHGMQTDQPDGIVGAHARHNGVIARPLQQLGQVEVWAELEWACSEASPQRQGKCAAVVAGQRSGGSQVATQAAPGALVDPPATFTVQWASTSRLGLFTAARNAAQRAEFEQCLRHCKTLQGTASCTHRLMLHLAQWILTVAVDDAPPVQVQQACPRIDRHAQAAAPGQQVSGCCLLAGSRQAVVQAAPAAVFCGTNGTSNLCVSE